MAFSRADDHLKIVAPSEAEGDLLSPATPPL